MIPGPLFCMARKVRQVAGPRLAMPCISLRVAVILSSFLLMRLSAVKPARFARAKEIAQGKPLRKEDLATSRPHSCTPANSISTWQTCTADVCCCSWHCSVMRPLCLTLLCWPSHFCVEKYVVVSGQAFTVLHRWRGLTFLLHSCRSRALTTLLGKTNQAGGWADTSNLSITKTLGWRLASIPNAPATEGQREGAGGSWRRSLGPAGW